MTIQQKLGKTAVVFIMLYLIVSGNRGLWNLYKLHQEKVSLTGQLVELRMEIRRCQNDYLIFSENDILLEKQAREELNLIKTDEMVYRFSKTR